jgi:septum formation protein
MIYLASQSPQRSQLLTEAGLAFQVVTSACDEEAIAVPHPQACAVERARGKALAVAAADAPAPGVILAADTVVSLGTERIGKPSDRAHARDILRRLQGTTHVVSTAHCCRVVGGREAVGVAFTKVTMKPMSQAEIDAYVESGESDQRAGAYAIQERGDQYVADLEGEFDTVVGLNLATVLRLVREVSNQAAERMAP